MTSHRSYMGNLERKEAKAEKLSSNTATLGIGTHVRSKLGFTRNLYQDREGTEVMQGMGRGFET